MRNWLRRHRWNGLSALGVVLLLWVGPYLFWRWKNSIKILNYRFVFVPEWFPAGAEIMFQPVAAVEGWINDEKIHMGGLGASFPNEAYGKATDEARQRFHERYEPVQGDVPIK